MDQDPAILVLLMDQDPDCHSVYVSHQENISLERSLPNVGEVGKGSGGLQVTMT